MPYNFCSHYLLVTKLAAIHASQVLVNCFKCRYPSEGNSFVRLFRLFPATTSVAILLITSVSLSYPHFQRHLPAAYLSLKPNETLNDSSSAFVGCIFPSQNQKPKSCTTISLLQLYYYTTGTSKFGKIWVITTIHTGNAKENHRLLRGGKKEERLGESGEREREREKKGVATRAQETQECEDITPTTHPLPSTTNPSTHPTSHVTTIPIQSIPPGNNALPPSQTPYTFHLLPPSPNSNSLDLTLIVRSNHGVLQLRKRGAFRKRLP